MTRSEGGFTLVEVLIATVVLGVGVVALAGAAGMTTRMLGRGRISTVAAQVATDQLERLRALAEATTVDCTHTNFKSSTAPVVRSGVTTSWIVPTTGTRRTVKVAVSYNTPRGLVRDTVSTIITCSTL
jgi:prepilin-type N-terminal cleavage/methylation domain-containing protein